MTNAHVSLRWWLLQSVTVLGSFYCYYLGLFGMLWTMDVSKISFIILGLFIGVTALIGSMTRRAEKNYVANQQYLETYNPVCWQLAGKMQDLGLIGTVIGFMVLLGPTFAGINLSDSAATQKMLGYMGLGMATALTTTLVGLVCAVLTRLQLLNLSTIIHTDEKDNDTF